MTAFLSRYIRAVDWFSTQIAKVAAVAIFIACVVSAANALIRYTFDVGSNAWLELQWYLSTVTIFLGAPALLRLNEHVRVDVLYGGRSPRTKAWIDLLGFLFMFFPVCVAFVWLSHNFVHDAWVQHEVSSNAGGLLRWPVKALIPLGFALLALQGSAEVLKRIGFLRNAYEVQTQYERPLQ